jgi:hypothetical protein
MTAIISCGGSGSPVAAVQSPSPSPATAIGPLVLSARECTYAGPGQISSGPASLEMTNRTKLRFNLDLWELDQGHTYAELVAHIKEEQRRAAAGEPELGHPTFATLVDQESVLSGSETKKIPNLKPGTYGFVCIAFERNGPGAIWVAGPLVVTS